MKIKGLLLKDFYELWGQAKVLIFLIVAYMFIGQSASGLSSIAVLLCAMLPTNCIGYDERAKWNRYALSMPLSPRDLVVSKYLLGYIGIAAGTILNMIVMLIPFFGGKANWVELAATFAIALLYLALQLPILFRFGIENGRIWMILFTAVFAIGAVTAGTVIAELAEKVSTYFLLLPVIALVLQIPSIALSVRFFKAK